MAILKPRALQRGDTVAIVFPCSRPLYPGLIAQAKAKLEEAGFRAIVGRHARDLYGDFAGRDEARLEDFHAAWADPQVKDIMANGGNGAIRLLPQIDYDLIRANPKIFMGLSDVTGLHLAIHKMAGPVTLHGPSAQNYDATLYSSTNFWRALTSRLALGELQDPVPETPYPRPYPPYRMSTVTSSAWRRCWRTACASSKCPPSMGCALARARIWPCCPWGCRPRWMLRRARSPSTSRPQRETAHRSVIVRRRLAVSLRGASLAPEAISKCAGRQSSQLGIASLHSQ